MLSTSSYISSDLNATSRPLAEREEKQHGGCVEEQGLLKVPPIAPIRVRAPGLGVEVGCIVDGPNCNMRGPIPDTGRPASCGL